MNEKPLFQFITTMEKKDYKDFLYFATFHKTKKIWISLFFLSSSLCFLLCIFFKLQTPLNIMSIWVFSAFLSLSFLLLKIEKQTRTLFEIKPNSSSHSFKKEQTVTIYQDRLTTTNRTSEGETTVTFPQLHEIYETTAFLILYFDPTLTSMIRKKDIPSNEMISLIQFLREKLDKRYHVL